MIAPKPCIVCHKKDYSPTLEQLRVIQRYLRDNNCKKIKDDYRARNIAESFMLSTKEHCSYGLSCQKLSNMSTEANKIAKEIEDDIIGFVQQSNYGELQEMLYFISGYFPQAYRVIEHYWHEYHREDDKNE